MGQEASHKIKRPLEYFERSYILEYLTIGRERRESGTSVDTSDPVLAGAYFQVIFRARTERDSSG